MGRRLYSRRFLFCAPALAAWALFAPISLAQADPWQPFLEVEAEAYGEPVSLHNMVNDWSGDFRSGETAFAYARAETGAKLGTWQIGLFWQYEYTLDFSADTAELYYRTENGLPLSEGRTYDVDLSVSHVQMRGLHLGKMVRLTRAFQVTLEGSYVEAFWLNDGRLTGTATAVAANDYDFDLRAGYHYSEDVLFDRPVDAPSGRGFLFDLSARWELAAGRVLAFETINLLSRIRWSEAPITQVRAQSNAKRFDDQGYVVFDPVLSGFERNEDYTQHLPRRFSISYKHELAERWDGLARMDHLPSLTVPRAGILYRAGRTVALELWHSFIIEAVTIRASSGWGYLAVAADDIRLEDAHYLALGAGLEIHF